MLADMTAEEWAYWVAEYRLHPWGDDYERTSLLLANILNTMIRMAPREAGNEPMTIPDDAFVPYREHEDEKLAGELRAVDDLEEMRGL